MSPIISGGGGGGGSQTQTQTVAINRAGGFIASHTFDLGTAGPHPVQVTLTLLSFTGDGETLGNDAGTLYVGEGSDQQVTTNTDNGTHSASIAVRPVNHFVAGAGAFVFELQGDGIAVAALGESARYLTIEPQLVSNDNGATYAGANNPVASVRIDLIYL